MVSAWKLRETREEYRTAAIQLTLAQIAGNKKLTIEDFLPSYCKPPKREIPAEIREAQLKAAMIAMAERSKKKAPN